MKVLMHSSGGIAVEEVFEDVVLTLKRDAPPCPSCGSPGKPEKSSDFLDAQGTQFGKFLRNHSGMSFYNALKKELGA